MRGHLGNMLIVHPNTGGALIRIKVRRPGPVLYGREETP